MKKKIVILGDSIVMPRPYMDEVEKTEYEDTYGYLLSQAFSDDVSVCFVGGLDTESALEGWNERYVAYKRPDIVIYHLGINDCVQRVFRKNSRSIHLKPWFRKLTRNFGIRLVNRYRRFFIRLVGKKNQYVKPDAFRKNLELLRGQVRTFSDNCRFIAIGICEKPEWQEHRSPGDNQLIKQYNAILQEEFGTAFVDPNRFGKANDILISDGIHFSRQTHERVAEELKRLLD
ncbi:MAG: SGNH/GDSL hydrolase family protein [Gammaproteobacteria bacterium]|nr:SGNH/GDSL hydrolase family protein [Gammaproteobacteria bacterium]